MFPFYEEPYAYSGSNPVSNLDPTGLFFDTIMDFCYNTGPRMVQCVKDFIDFKPCQSGHRSRLAQYADVTIDAGPVLAEGVMAVGCCAAQGGGSSAAGGPVGRRSKMMSDVDPSPHTPQHRNGPGQIVQNRPGFVNKVEYSGHALDQMRNRGLVPSVVENAIATGSRAPGNLPGTTVITDASNSVRVVINSNGKVITVE